MRKPFGQLAPEFPDRRCSVGGAGATVASARLSCSRFSVMDCSILEGRFNSLAEDLVRGRGESLCSLPCWRQGFCCGRKYASRNRYRKANGKERVDNRCIVNTL